MDWTAILAGLVIAGAASAVPAFSKMARRPEAEDEDPVVAPAE